MVSGGPQSGRSECPNACQDVHGECPNAHKIFVFTEDCIVV